MSNAEMEKTVAELTAPGKGILAADESGGTIEKRFKVINVTSTEDTRRDYRELLFSASGLASFISGVILYEETLKQKSAAGTPLPQLLKEQGIVPGIKVDKGTVALPRFPGEKLTQGLDGLAERLTEYRSSARASQNGARSSTLPPAFPRHRRSPPMRMRSRVTRRCARTSRSCRSSSPKC
jgi:fructose-bisphosphate aldolase class I